MTHLFLPVFFLDFAPRNKKKDRNVFVKKGELLTLRVLFCEIRYEYLRRWREDIFYVFFPKKLLHRLEIKIKNSTTWRKTLFFLWIEIRWPFFASYEEWRIEMFEQLDISRNICVHLVRSYWMKTQHIFHQSGMFTRMKSFTSGMKIFGNFNRVLTEIYITSNR